MLNAYHALLFLLLIIYDSYLTQTGVLYSDGIVSKGPIVVTLFQITAKIW